MNLARKAVLYTLLVHVVVMGGMMVWPVSKSQTPSEVYAEVDMMDLEDQLTSSAQSYEEKLKKEMQQKVANLRANAESQRSSEEKSSADDVKSDASLAEEVEAELRAMEEEEFARLAASEKEFETAGEANVVRQDVGQTFERWDAQYDGLVTVRYSLTGRTGRDLDVPGYTCVGGAQVDVAIVVDPTGRVVEAKLLEGDPEGCFGAAALRSARMAKFNASSQSPKRQEGRLTYVFVAQ